MTPKGSANLGEQAEERLYRARFFHSRAKTRSRRLQRKWKGKTIWARSGKLVPLVYPRFRKRDSSWTRP